MIVKIIKSDNPKNIKGMIHRVSADTKYSSKVKYMLFGNTLKDGKFYEKSHTISMGYIENYAINIVKNIQLESWLF